MLGLPRRWIGLIFLLATVVLYAGIGVMSRTSDAAEYYVAGRRVPAMYNGMATGADWMSAASFIGMAGTLYLTGYGGLAFIMGWTGGYCLVALFLAPYLRKFGQFTIPDFLGARYEGNAARCVGVFAAILCSFTYVVAQIHGVGRDHRAADRAWSSRSASSSAWAASWCAPSSAACARSPGPRWRSTSSSSSPT